MTFKKRPITRLRSDKVCPWCGMRYERFRSGSVPSWQDAQARVLDMAKEHAASGNYNLPCRRGGILGLMHECKMGAWKDEHLEWCKQEFEENERLATAVANPAPEAQDSQLPQPEDEVPF